MSRPYNYERFEDYVECGDDEREFGAFPNMLHAGERAPDRAEEIWAERARAARRPAMQ